MGCEVCITITTLNEELTGRLEPGAPTSEKRLDTIRLLSEKGIPVAARLDPIIPGINESEIDEIASAVCSVGALHITTSTYKARPDSWKRLKDAFPEESEALGAMFEKGSLIGGSRYLPEEVRFALIQKMKKAATKNGATFSTCREGFSKDPGVCCDGSHLTRQKR
jgi:DNA repair photolyase